MNELVSVVISTYNRSAVLRRAIHSVLGQSYGQLEVLVCDDGSSDDTEQVVTGIDDPRVRWLPGVHAGRPSVPKNRGIVHSRGLWVACLDHDDQWLPDKLSQQLELAQRLGCQAVCANMHKIIPGQGATGTMLSNRMRGLTKISFAHLLQMNVVMSSTAMVRRSLMEELGGFPECVELAVNDDYALWLRVATRTDFAYLHEAVVDYQWDGANLSAQQKLDFWEDKRRVMRDFLLWSVNRSVLPAQVVATQAMYERALTHMQESERMTRG